MIDFWQYWTQALLNCMQITQSLLDQNREAGSSEQSICSWNTLTLLTPTTCDMNTNVNEKNEEIFLYL